MDRLEHNETLSYGIILILTYLCLAMLTPHGGFAGDIDYWATWTKTLVTNGLGRAYESGINYHPLFLYVLTAFGFLRNTEEAIRAHIHELKYLVLLFDFLAAYLLIRFLTANKRSALPAFFILFNPAYLYNTMIWGQVDAIHTFFSFASLLTAMHGGAVTSSVLFLLALNMKAQAIIFLPFLALFLLPYFFDFRTFLKSFFSVAGVQALLLLPFILEDRMKSLIRTVLHAVDYNPVVSMNAFNAWYLFFRGDLSALPDAAAFMGISYKVWGLMSFSVVSLSLLFAVGPRIFTRARHKEPYHWEDYQLFFLCLGLISIAFFYFNTQMHERYAHPAILFLGVYGVLSGRYIIFVLVSLGYLLNMDAVLGFLKLPIREPGAVSLLFLVSFVTGAYEICVLTIPRFANASARVAGAVLRYPRDKRRS